MTAPGPADEEESHRADSTAGGIANEWAMRLARAHVACSSLGDGRPLAAALDKLAVELVALLDAQLVVVCATTPAGPLRAACPAGDSPDWFDVLRTMNGESISTVVTFPSGGRPAQTSPPTQLQRLGIARWIVSPLGAAGIEGTLSLGFGENRGRPADEMASFEVLAAHLSLALAQACRAAQTKSDHGRTTAGGEGPLQASEELIAVAVHELRTPLTPLTMLLHSLERKAKTGIADIDAFTRARRQVDRLTQLIADLLDLSRLRRGRLDLHPASVDLGQALRQAAQTFQERQAKLRVDLSTVAAPVCIVADEPRLPQSLVSLLEHVARSSPAANVITVELREREGQAIISFLAISDPPLHRAGGPEAPEGLSARTPAKPQPSHANLAKGIAMHLAEELIGRQGGTISVAEATQGGLSLAVTFPRAGPS